MATLTMITRFRDPRVFSPTMTTAAVTRYIICPRGIVIASMLLQYGNYYKHLVTVVLKSRAPNYLYKSAKVIVAPSLAMRNFFWNIKVRHDLSARRKNLFRPRTVLSSRVWLTEYMRKYFQARVLHNIKGFYHAKAFIDACLFFRVYITC